MGHFRIYIDETGKVVKSDIFSSRVKLICSNFDILPRKHVYPILTISLYEHNGKVNYSINQEFNAELICGYPIDEYSIKTKQDLIDWIATQTHYMKLRKMMESNHD